MASRETRTQGGRAPALHVLDHTSSTQDAARDLLRSGEQPPLAVLTRDQRSGRGRLGRPWSTPLGGGLALTLARRSGTDPAARSWYPLVAGLGALEALRGATGAGDGIGLKWPNDLLTADGRKLGGILLEGDGSDHVLVGIGVNLAGPIELADPAALPPAWLWGEGGIAPAGPGPVDLGPVDPARDAAARALAAAIAEGVERELALLDVHEGDAMASGQRGRYGMACLTLGSEVRFDDLSATSVPAAGADAGQAPSGGATARALRLDADGRLVLGLPAGAERVVSAGDVRHLRTVGDDAAPPGAAAATSAPASPDDIQETHP
ncbi:biotin--[acetyl-CoA-carboxylase] ligase [Brachybacterium sp. MASK1Z-5]|uniref:Biotin--[acetyl-CoA-carboxylase] ligase n=1 Tax=Brachybacterium halotolerans TaxID=2795215 RepID=A0ABS1BBV4_9MICO|nr:biotin--[acetyl-CoA-carboxylase] ligase [Brachybacterium halotolerans]MBK0332146.1 biotin--[acetyl-CoA-carboxylase] ligase [Brachybacterium halotolerans]